ERLGDRALAPLHPQSGLVVAAAAADFAGDENVGEEVHLDLAHARAFAGLATPAAHVEAEAAGRVAESARLRRTRVEVADAVERLGVGRGVRARGATNRVLVDVDDLVELLDTLEALVGADALLRVVQRATQRRVQDAVHQRRFARARHAGHRAQHAERE